MEKQNINRLQLTPEQETELREAIPQHFCDYDVAPHPLQSDYIAYQVWKINDQDNLLNVTAELVTLMNTLMLLPDELELKDRTLLSTRQKVAWANTLNRMVHALIQITEKDCLPGR